jgi:hypothetical protein
MDAFVVPGSTPEEFVARIEREVRAEDFDSIVSPRLIGNRLEVRFSYLGTSVLAYDLADQGDGFRAALVQRRMSPFSRTVPSRLRPPVRRRAPAAGRPSRLSVCPMPPRGDYSIRANTSMAAWTRAEGASPEG